MLKSLPLPIPKMFLYSYEYKKLKLDHLFPAKVLTALCARARLKPKTFKMFDSARTSILAVKLNNPYISVFFLLVTSFILRFF